MLFVVCSFFLSFLPFLRNARHHRSYQNHWNSVSESLKKKTIDLKINKIFHIVLKKMFQTSFTSAGRPLALEKVFSIQNVEVENVSCLDCRPRQCCLQLESQTTIRQPLSPGNHPMLSTFTVISIQQKFDVAYEQPVTINILLYEGEAIIALQV